MSSIAIAPPETQGRLMAGLSAISAAFSDTADVAGRNLRTLLRTPQALVSPGGSPPRPAGQRPRSRPGGGGVLAARTYARKGR